jgi:hypothetical protein
MRMRARELRGDGRVRPWVAVGPGEGEPRGTEGEMENEA